MKLLYVGDKFAGDDSFLDRLSRMPALSGHQVVTSFTKRENSAELALIARSHKVDAVICSQQSLLECTLRAQPDFIPPPTRKQLTLDDYAGSWLTLPYDIPMLIIGHLDRLVTVPYEKFILDRYLSKLTRPTRWHQQTPFLWKQVHEHTTDAALTLIEAASLLAIDIETLGDEDRSIGLVGYATYSFATQESHCFVVHFDSEWAWRFVQRANRSNAQKIFQNGQYDNTYFARWNCLPSNWLWDTLTLMHCWYSELPKRLDFITSFALRKMRYWKDDGKSGSMEDQMRYNAMDCWATLNSFLSLIKEIPPYAMRNYLIEFPMNFPSLNCALEGIKVNPVTFAAVKKDKEAEAESILTRARYLLSDDGFNPRSAPQMLKLFTLLGCGALGSTGKAQMLKARAASPLNDFLLGLLVKYKEAATLISNYLGENIVWNERFYYAIDPAGTDTGRSASKASAFWCGGNVQKIPRGDKIKRYLEADTGWLLGEADKAQAEARCVGYLAGEDKLIAVVEGPNDYHAWNASAFFGIPYKRIYDNGKRETINEELRDLSKRTNHGANYNMGGFTMLDTMGPKKVAEAKRVLKLPLYMRLVAVCDFMLDKYDKTYPKVKGLMYEKIISTIETTNKLVSPLGWTRYFFSKPSKKNKPALNAAVAHGPQNLNVSILNQEWYSIWHETLYGTLRNEIRIKAQIHDSLLFQYKDLEAAKIVLSMMQSSIPVAGADGVTRDMKIPSDMKCGAVVWSQLKKLKQ